jgi:hypothetical protein
MQINEKKGSIKTGMNQAVWQLLQQDPEDRGLSGHRYIPKVSD